MKHPYFMKENDRFEQIFTNGCCVFYFKKTLLTVYSKWSQHKMSMAQKTLLVIESEEKNGKKTQMSFWLWASSSE